MRVIAVTGANGFVGQALCDLLQQCGHTVRGVVRRDAFGGQVAVGNIGPATEWVEALAGVDAVVHLAARVHVMRERVADPLEAFREVNVFGTLNLAGQAADAGVRRFVYLSSIKVNGEQTVRGQRFGPDDKPFPDDPYGVSKWEAEERLLELGNRTGMEIVIIRPPLVYGPGVKANFLAMMRWLSKGVPLPLGGIHNGRSFVGLDNLVDFIVTCVNHPTAANQTFLVADGKDLSTTELLRRLGDALGVPARLLPVPPWILETGAAVVGKRAIAQRLCGSLQVDISKTREVLGWEPPVSVDEGLRKTVEWYKGQGSRSKVQGSR